MAHELSIRMPGLSFWIAAWMSPEPVESGLKHVISGLRLSDRFSNLAVPSPWAGVLHFGCQQHAADETTALVARPSTRSPPGAYRHPPATRRIKARHLHRHSLGTLPNDPAKQRHFNSAGGLSSSAFMCQVLPRRFHTTPRIEDPHVNGISVSGFAE
jgi:hypothetical protein